MSADAMNTDVMCTVAEDIPKKIKALKFSSKKTQSAILLKINVKEDLIVIDEEFNDCTTEELQEELPDCQPRFLVYSYVHTTKDGRTTYPFFVIYYKPSGCKSEQLMRYAGSKNTVLKVCDTILSCDLDDKEDFDDEWIRTHFKLK